LCNYYDQIKLKSIRFNSADKMSVIISHFCGEFFVIQVAKM